MFARSQETGAKLRTYKEGQRLYCHTCGSEIEIITPCTGASAGQVLRCCGHDMEPEVGKSVHLEAES
jgi:hypothetical protein